VTLLDNATPARLLSDINIYPNAHADYQSLGWDGYKGQVLGGADYTIIRPEILKVREHILPFDEHQCILVTMGGADPNHLTEKVMGALRPLAETVDVKVVVGPHAKLDQSGAAVSLSEHFDVIEDPYALGELMCRAGLAVTSLGVTIYELAYMGVPTVVISNYENDVMDEERLKVFHGIIPLGYHGRVDAARLCDVVENVWFDVSGRREEHLKLQRSIDGMGLENVCLKLSESNTLDMY